MPEDRAFVKSDKSQIQPRPTWVNGAECHYGGDSRQELSISSQLETSPLTTFRLIPWKSEFFRNSVHRCQTGRTFQLSPFTRLVLIWDHLKSCFLCALHINGTAGKLPPARPRPSIISFLVLHAPKHELMMIFFASLLLLFQWVGAESEAWAQRQEKDTETEKERVSLSGEWGES